MYTIEAWDPRFDRPECDHLVSKRSKGKENGEFYGYHSMREVEMMRMMTIERMTRNSLQA